MIAVIFSEKDIASLNIKERLRELGYLKDAIGKLDNNLAYRFKDILFVTIKKDLIYADYLDALLKDYQISLYIFASRHKSESEIPALLTHTTGNWTDKALFGGSPNSLAIAPAIALKYAYQRLNYYVDEYKLRDKFMVSYEVSHHGPTNLSIPLIFIELGSSPENWRDEKGATVLANTIIDLAENYNTLLNSDFEIAIGFGGSHYCPSFSNLILNSPYAFGHIAPKYAFDAGMKPEMIIQAYHRTYPKPKYAILDWKGLKKEYRDIVISKAEELGLTVKKTKEIEKDRSCQ
ncbi:MAG: D-aminoacyl-tRNA deacylase [Candidatus Asgardarchaeum sp.]|nr:D-tyrosyl-tRNA(Tyr) deacylase [Candidatus Odinarchaeota archaeon]